MRHLAKSDGAESQALPDRAVVVARTMGPAELLDYGRNRITALVVEALRGRIKGIAAERRGVAGSRGAARIRYNEPSEQVEIFLG
jgi:signal transduction protein with GAF and PtsI domain